MIQKLYNTHNIDLRIRPVDLQNLVGYPED